MNAIILSLLGFVLGFAYSAWRITSIIPPQSPLRWVALGLWLLLFALMILTFVGRGAIPTSVMAYLYPISTSWLIYLIYFVMGFALIDLLRILPVLRPLLQASWGLTFAFAGTMLLIFVYASRHYQHKVRVPLELKLTKHIDKPLRIVAISDMHLGYTIGKGELEQWVQLINSEKPDLVLIAGDLVDGDTRPLIESNIAETLNKISAPVYACLGNHEYIGGEAIERKFVGRTKVQLLQDSVALWDNRLYIVGRDDRSNPYRQSLETLTQGLDRSKPIIVLDHQPYALEESERAGVDLQLSGHTHRGQVFPINLIVDRMYEVSHGYKQRSDTHYYISSGIGIWGGKYRIGTQSEYVVIDIKP